MSRKKRIELQPTDIEQKTQEEIWENLQYKKLLSPKLFQKFNLTEKQKELIDLLENNEIITIIGPAGTGKTLITSYYALKSLNEHKFEKIILTKPIKEAGEELGFLPGDIKEKIDPHYESYRTNIMKFIDEKTYNRLIEKKYIETKPLAYMRGTTLDNSICILDEAQNASMKQLMLFLTRMGKNSKIIITGDVRQFDIRKNDVALPFLIRYILNDIDNVKNFEFDDEDIMRNPILIKITQKYEVLKENEMIPKNF